MDKSITNSAELERNFIKKYIRAYLRWAVWCVVVAVIWVVGMHAYFAARITSQASITIAYVIAIIPFFCFKLWKVFSTQSYEGTITKIENKMVLKSDTVVACRETMKRRCILRITIKTNRGDVYTEDLDYQTEAFGVPYQIGDRVRKFRGASFLQLVTDDPERKKLCVFCGADIDYDICKCCGMHVIL